MPQYDKNLLIAIYAAQHKAVPADKIVKAGVVWSLDPGRSMGEVLVEMGALDAEDVAYIENLVEKSIALHHGNARTALEAIGGADIVTRTFHGALSIGPTGRVDTVPMAAEPFLRDTNQILSGADEIPGRYSFISDYARGGMGRVLLVHDQHFGRQVALKELLLDEAPPEPGSTEASLDATVSMAARFLQEARVTGQLEHPAIVPVYELGRRNNGTPYYTMKFVRGKTLSHAIGECKTLLDRLNVLPHLIDLCNAIAYAHSRNVIHRDIKPSNIMVGEFGETVVLDWGIAKLKGMEDAHLPEIKKTLRDIQLGELKQMPETAYGKAMGTPNYMPPEQASGHLDEIDERSDVYSLGAVLYEVLTGEPPFTGGSVLEVMLKVVGSEPGDIHEAVPDAPPELVGICRKAMSKERGKRYASAMELAEEIRRFQSGSLVKAYTYSPGELVRHYYQRNRTFVHTLAAALLVLFGVLIFSYINIYNARNAEMEAREDAEYNAYVSQIRLAQAQMDDQKYEIAFDTLSGINPDLRGWEWGYLLQQASPELLHIEIPGATVFAAEFSPDGRQLATLSVPDQIQVWNAETGQHIQDMKLVRDRHNVFAFSPDGKTLAGGGADGDVYTWDAATGELRWQARGHARTITSIDFTQDSQRLLTTTTAPGVCIWDVATGVLLHTAAPEASVNAATFINGDADVLYSTEEHTHRWRLEADEHVYAVPGANAQVSPDGSQFLVIDGPAIRTHAVSTGAAVQELEKADANIWKARWAHDGKRILAPAMYFGLGIWDAATGKRIATLDHPQLLRDFEVNPRQPQILTVADDQQWRLWSLEEQRMTLVFGQGGGLRMRATFNPSGTRIATTAPDEAFRVWHTGKFLGRHTLCRFPLPLQQARHIGQSGIIQLQEQWKPLKPTVNSPLTVISMYDSQARSIDRLLARNGTGSTALLNPQGTMLAVAPDNNLLCFISIGSDEIKVMPPVHAGTIREITFSNDGSILATGGWEGLIHLIDMQKMATLSTITAHDSSVNGLAFSPDQQFLASSDIDRRVKIWDVGTGALHQTFETPYPATCLKFDSASQVLWIGTDRGHTYRCALPDFIPSSALAGHSGRVQNLSQNEAGSRILTTAIDPFARLSDTVKTEELALLSSNDKPFLDAWFGKEDLVYTVNSAGILERWYGTPESLTAKSYTDSQTFKAEFDAYKASRYQTTDASEAPPVRQDFTYIVCANKSQMRDAIQALIDVPKNHEIGGLQTAGVPVSEASALAKMVLMPGDRILQWNGLPLDTTESSLSAFQGALANLDRSTKNTLELSRDGNRHVVQWHLIDIVHGQHTVSLSEEEAREMLIYEIAILDDAERAGDLKGRTFSSGSADFFRPGIEGFHFLHTSMGPSEEYMRRLGICPIDRLVRYNGVPVENLSQLLQLYRDAKAALDAGSSPALTMEIHRGDFQILKLTINIQPPNATTASQSAKFAPTQTPLQLEEKL